MINQEKTQSDRLEKATTKAWRILWGLIYMIIAPAGTFLVTLLLSNYFSGSIYFAINFSVTISLVSLFLFYNPNAWVHVPFLISLLANLSTFFIEIFTPADIYFEFLPMVIFGVLYHVIWLYLVANPVGGVNYPEKRFRWGIEKSGIPSSILIFVLIANYVLQLAFILFYIPVRFFWVNAMMFNFAIWIITFKLTRGARDKIIKGIKNG